MNAIDELIKYLAEFTPDQLEKFLLDKVTLSILQPEAATESAHQVALGYEQ